MEVQKYCVYNQTRESFLSLGVTVTDPATAQVRELIDKVGARPDSGVCDGLLIAAICPRADIPQSISCIPLTATIESFRV